MRFKVSTNLWSLSPVLGEPQVCPRGIQGTSLQTTCHDAPPRTGGIKGGPSPCPSHGQLPNGLGEVRAVYRSHFSGVLQVGWNGGYRSGLFKALHIHWEFWKDI